MKQRYQQCELFITPAMPLEIIRDTFVVRSRIREGVLIVGPGYKSKTSIFVEPELEPMLQFIIDFQNLELQPEYQGITRVLLLDNIMCCSLLTDSDTYKELSGTSVYDVISITKLSIMSSSLMTNLINERIAANRIYPQRDWIKLPLIKFELPREYSMVTGTSKSETAIFKGAVGNPFTRLDKIVKLGEQSFILAELHSVEGDVFLLGPDRSVMDQFLAYLEKCHGMAKHFSCFVTIWGFTKYKLENGQFALQIIDFKEISASIFTRLSESHRGARGDYRASIIREALLEKESTPISTVKEQTSVTAEENSMIKESVLTQLESSVLENSDLPLLGHIVHTHIIKYEAVGSFNMKAQPTQLMFDQKTISRITAQVLPTIVVKSSALKLANSSEQEKALKLLEEDKSKNDARFESEARNLAETQKRINNDQDYLKKRKAYRLPIQEKDGHYMNHMDVEVKKVPINTFPTTNPANNGPSPQKLAEISQAHNKEVINSSSNYTTIPIQSISSKPQGPKSQIKDSICATKSRNCSNIERKNGKSSNKKPLIPEQIFFEDGLTAANRAVKAVECQEPIKAFNHNQADTANLKTEEETKPKRTKLKTSASIFKLSDSLFSNQTFSNAKMKQAEDYFGDFL
jgi:hypothetical protein